MPAATSFGRPRQAALLEELQAHHGVLEEEAPRVVAVGADAAHPRRQVDHEVGPRVGEQAPHGVAIDEVVLRRARHEHGRALALEALDDERAQEARRRR